MGWNYILARELLDLSQFGLKCRPVPPSRIGFALRGVTLKEHPLNRDAWDVSQNDCFYFDAAPGVAEFNVGNQTVLVRAQLPNESLIVPAVHEPR